MPDDVRPIPIASGPPAALVRASIIAFVVPALLLGGAYVSQYGFGLFPCEMCWWQRYPHFVALGFALLALIALSKRAGRATMLLTALAGLAILVSGLIGGFHAGVEYGWWQGPTACSNISPVGEGDDFWKDMMAAPVIRCDQAPFTLAGISLAGFNFLISVLAALFIFIGLFGGERRAPSRVSEGRSMI